MEIVPHTRIYLLENVRLDNTYENTIFWEQGQEAAQQAYFMGKCPNLTTHSFTDVNYQRVNKGVLRIKGIPEIIMKCNYMMFQNRIEMIDYPNAGTTTNQNFDWVYAFITDVSYVSTFCAEITYEIDVLQTFHFKYSLGQSLVEREHTPTDEIGEHIIDESIPIGDYEIKEMYETTGSTYIPAFSQNQMSIVVATTFDDQYQDAVGGDYGAFFSGLCYHSYTNDATGRAQCKNFISNATNKTDGIVAIFLAPKWAMDYITTPSSTNVPRRAHTLPAPQAYDTVYSFTPKNKKLYTYPYNYMYAYDCGGNVAEYRFEKFRQTSPDVSQQSFTLTEYFDFSCSPALRMFPLDYEKVGFNIIESLTCGPLPQLSWVSDTYKAWIAQNGSSLALNTIGNAVMAISQGAGNIVGNMGNEDFNMGTGIASQAISASGKILGNALGMLGEISHASKLPDQSHGNTNSTQLFGIMEELHFRIYRRFVREDYAKTIDNYFTMFGYKVNKIEVPNRKARQEFTYLKLVECTLQTNQIPQTYIDKIKQIYMKGIRYWVHPANIGGYDLSNEPINGGGN